MARGTGTKGLSWQQRLLLIRLLQKEKHDWPVAWREVNSHGWQHVSSPDFDTARVQWNIEQTTRRALRCLQDRGLVRLGAHAFDPIQGNRGIEWCYIHPGKHVPGRSRWMTGAMLTEAGREVARMAQEETPRSQ
jgi:hypothetical protein